MLVMTAMLAATSACCLEAGFEAVQRLLAYYLAAVSTWLQRALDDILTGWVSANNAGWLCFEASTVSSSLFY